MTTTTPHVPLPPGTHVISDWDQWGHKYRVVSTAERRVETTNFLISTTAVQLPDGTIERDDADDRPSIWIDQLVDGQKRDQIKVTLEDAIRLADELLKEVGQTYRMLHEMERGTESV
jgi:uncharacterized protein YaaN involved in tellurite resistance